MRTFRWQRDGHERDGARHTLERTLFFWKCNLPLSLLPAVRPASCAQCASSVTTPRRGFGADRMRSNARSVHRFCRKKFRLSRRGAGKAGSRPSMACCRGPRTPVATVRRPKGKQSGRTQEIQRLIGRSLRAVFDLQALGERTVSLDCDVLQADGGTRTAAITSAYVAAQDAVARLVQSGALTGNPIREAVAAVSCLGVLCKARRCWIWSMKRILVVPLI